MSVRKLTFCATCVALSVVTGFIRIFEFPFGGSVTLCAMLFIVLPAWFYGPAYGVASGLIYGLIKFAFSPYFVTLPQFLFDYIFAFVSMCVAGFFRDRKNGLITGYALAVTARWIMASIAGLIWVSLGSTAWEGWAPLPYSMAYNASYIFAEGAVTVFLLLIPAVRKALEKVKELSALNTKGGKDGLQKEA